MPITRKERAAQAKADQDAAIAAAAAAAGADGESAVEKPVEEHQEGGILARDDYDELHGLLDNLPLDLQDAQTALDGIHSGMSKKQLLEAFEGIKGKVGAGIKELQEKAAQQDMPLPESLGRDKDANSEERINNIIGTRKANAELSADNKGLEGTDREAFIAQEMARALARQVATNEARATEQAAKEAATAKKAADLQKAADVLKAKAEAEEVERVRAEAEKAARTRQQMKVLKEQKEAAEQKAAEETKKAEEAKKALKKAAKSPAKGNDDASSLPANIGHGTKRRWADRDEKIVALGEEKVLKLEAAAASRKESQEKRIIEEWQKKNGAVAKPANSESALKDALCEAMFHFQTVDKKYNEEVIRSETLKKQRDAARACKKAMQEAAKNAGVSVEEINAINAKHAESKGSSQGSSSNA